PSLGINKQFLQGLFFAPSVVASSLKTALLASCALEQLGYQVDPKYDEDRADIVQNIIFGNSKDLIAYCQGIQMASPIDSNAVPEPWDMPGYEDKVIMAAGAFTQGSSIELSCDGPIRPPYIAYMQGGLTYSYGKLGVMKAISKIKETSKLKEDENND
ncbi:MAG: methionine gamma-lyase family protein, partial [Bacilli bacterium]|nr:methionine gamma-lyase family protein [Bacilli bacterium]